MENWQLCPKCKGQPDYYSGIQCPVCNGNYLISCFTGLPPTRATSSPCTTTTITLDDKATLNYTH